MTRAKAPRLVMNLGVGFNAIPAASRSVGMDNAQNQRRSPRVRIAAVASLQTHGTLNANNQALCGVKDISRTGIGIETGQPPIPGQAVLLRLALDDTFHELKTRATRVRRRGQSNFFEVGLDWTRCSAPEMAFLDAVLAVVEQQPLV